MAGRTPRLAVNAFVDPIKEAVGCFASCKVSFDVDEPETEGVLTFNEGGRVPFRRAAGSKRVGLEALMRYRIVEAAGSRGPWKVNTTAWVYDLYRDDQHLLSFHWHPISSSHYVLPHFHAKASRAYHRLHIPTGRVLFEDVLTLAEELGAAPKRSDWLAVCAKNRDNFALGASWGVHHRTDDD